MRKEKQIPFKTVVELHVINNGENSKTFDYLISKLGNISTIKYTDSNVDKAFSFRVKSNEYFMVADITIDLEAEVSKLEEELEYTKGFLNSVRKNFQTNVLFPMLQNKWSQAKRKKRPML